MDDINKFIIFVSGQYLGAYLTNELIDGPEDKLIDFIDDTATVDTEKLYLTPEDAYRNILSEAKRMQKFFKSLNGQK